MTVHLPLICLVAILAYLGYRLARPPFWLVVVLVLVGFLSAGTFFAPVIHSGARAGVDILDSTTGWGADGHVGDDRQPGDDRRAGDDHPAVR